MAYETGSASDINDLLNKLRVFALAHGWTIDYHGVRTNTAGVSQGNGLNALMLSKGGVYWGLLHTTSGGWGGVGPWVNVSMYAGPWVPNGGGTDSQPNRSASATANKMVGPFVGYHFFGDPVRSYLHVVVEVSAGSYRHFGIGVFDQVGAAAVAAYTYASAPYFANMSYANDPGASDNIFPWCEYCSDSSVFGAMVRFDSDGLSPRYLKLSRNESDANRAFGSFRNSSSGASSLIYAPMQVAPSNLTGRAPLFPAIVMASRNGSSTQRSIVGQPFDLRVLRINNITPGDVITIGSDQWRVFPVVRKSAPAGVENSGSWGYAFRMVP
jgi:hypothetical protein